MYKRKKGSFKNSVWISNFGWSPENQKWLKCAFLEFKDIQDKK